MTLAPVAPVPADPTDWSRTALVIGAGPAGLMAAEALAAAGIAVVVAEAKPSPARKFLMAGKSGLNITKDEPPDAFLAAFDAPDWLRPMLAQFGPAQVLAWVQGLGQAVFTGSSGRAFPVAMKGSPLLRAWLLRLGQAGVTLRTGWRWQGFAPACSVSGAVGFDFATPEGAQVVRPAVTVLALGGASWMRLGSDAAWVPWLAGQGVAVTAFQPANMGFWVEWSAHMARHFGQPIKGAALCVGTNPPQRGEFVISAKGVEGGGIYAVSRALRMGQPLLIDLMPDVPLAEVTARLARMRSGETAANRLRKLGLSAAAVALVQEWGRGLPLAEAVKSLPAKLGPPRPMDEAISVAGGVAQKAVTPDLELCALPRVFVAGEMLDWEAPTGGYLLTASWATGLWAGQAAARKVAGQQP